MRTSAVRVLADLGADWCSNPAPALPSRRGRASADRMNRNRGQTRIHLDTVERPWHILGCGSGARKLGAATMKIVISAALLFALSGATPAQEVGQPIPASVISDPQPDPAHPPSSAEVL